ncbi:HNH endonuclease [Brasilonema sp. CT11]|nr:HNH endonuclease [Brasilonema sp. CT11]
MVNTQNWECVYNYTDVASYIYGAAITPDGKKLVSASYEKILIHDLTTNKICNILLGHSALILSIDISPDGKFVASGGDDKQVKIWNLETGELINTLSLRADVINCVAFSPDGQFIAAGGTNKYRNNDSQVKTTTIYLWNFQTGKLIATLGSHRLRINQIIFSPNGQILVSKSSNGTVKVWNLETLKVIYKLRGETNPINGIVISPDAKQLWGITIDKILNWDLYTGKLIKSLCGEFKYTLDLCISLCGTILIVYLFNNIQAWDLTTKKQVFLFPFDCHNIFSNINKITDKLISCAYTNQGAIIKIWKLPDCKNYINLEIASFLIRLENEISSDTFIPGSIKDARIKIFTSIVVRRGQKIFREKLLNAYNKLCVITECDVEHVLEAAHIYPYKGDDTNKTWNGLILRADIHTLFDLYLITINPETKKVCLSPELKNTSYSKFEGKEIRLPQNVNLNLFKEALQWHYKQCTWINN